MCPCERLRASLRGFIVFIQLENQTEGHSCEIGHILCAVLGRS